MSVGRVVMPGSGLSSKLKLKSGQRAAVIDAPPGYVEEELSPLPAGVELHVRLEGRYDWIQLFARTRAQLESIAPTAVSALNGQSLMWVSFPKRTSGMQTDLSRDQGWDFLHRAGLQWVTLVSLNDAWSAFAMRPFRQGEQRKSFR